MHLRFFILDYQFLYLEKHSPVSSSAAKSRPTPEGGRRDIEASDWVRLALARPIEQIKKLESNDVTAFSAFVFLRKECGEFYWFFIYLFLGIGKSLYDMRYNLICTTFLLLENITDDYIMIYANKIAQSWKKSKNCFANVMRLSVTWGVAKNNSRMLELSKIRHSLGFDLGQFFSLLFYHQFLRSDLNL